MGEQRLFITSSIGIAIAPHDGDNYESLLKHADIAMYRAKQQGRNRYATYSPTLQEDLSHRLRLENDLHGAHTRDEMRLFFQPQVDLATGRVVGVEALIRWDHPELGLIEPDLVHLARRGVRADRGDRRVGHRSCVPSGPPLARRRRRTVANGDQPGDPRPARSGLFPTWLPKRSAAAGWTPRNWRWRSPNGWWARAPTRCSKRSSRLEGTGGPSGHRRLRHRQLRAQPPTQLSDRHAQDRQELRAGGHRRAARGAVARGDGEPRPRPRVGRGGRRGRDPSTGRRSSALRDATWHRATCSRCPRARPTSSIPYGSENACSLPSSAPM